MTVFPEPGHKSHAGLYMAKLQLAVKGRSSGVFRDDPALGKVPNFFTEAQGNGFRAKPRYRFVDHSSLASLSVCHLQIAQLYTAQIRFHCTNGHGFAAEQGNHLIDRIRLRNSRIMGDNNAANGPDRLVDGLHIQSKYCSTGKSCIDECFGKSGRFKYVNSDGSVMQIEVPSDVYAAAVEAMKEKIKAGLVPGVSDPEKASEIVRKGSLTYKQAVNIAKFGTLESLTFDAVNGLRIGLVSGSLSAVVTFALAIHAGEPVSKALRSAAWVGFKVGGLAMAISIITSQIGRTAFEHTFRTFSSNITRMLSSKAASALVKAMTGKVLHGNVARATLARVLRSNIASLAVSTVIMSVPDIVKTFRGRISGSQLTKNLSKIAAGAAGGYGGGVAGAVVGTMILPGAGTYAGYAVGGLIGGYLGSAATGAVLDNMIIDDAVAMLVLLEQELIRVVLDYCMVKQEVESTLKSLVDNKLPKLLETIYAQEADKRSAFTYEHIEKLATQELKKRKPVTVPNEDEMAQELGALVGELAAEFDVGNMEAGAETPEVYIPEVPLGVAFHGAFKQDYDLLSDSIIVGPRLNTEKGRKKLGNALNTYGRDHGGVPIHSILAVVDTTILGAATEGAIFTDEAVWIRSIMSKSFKLDYVDFDATVRMEKGEFYLTSCQSLFVPCVYARNDIERFIKLIKEHFRRP
ncbi:hypothetical protein [Pseudomonas asiatica]|uniref:hypothetical protein n=1 Tax=Pseudomonas asiatica TaxID=2219225 RepID=UPI0025A491EE|nr:hypothetical protein [Pseudomonas asiatica]WJN48587.1 hypothetical protein QUR91_18285 [Pseudomonas asiatica]WJN48591.1 hypothetical protein QUR91_18305 [Pseudomonas asiatica]